MPSQSQIQQMMFGIAYAVKTGEKKISDVDPEYRDRIEKLVKGMTKKQLRDFAATKHEGLPYQKEGFDVMSFDEFLSEFMIGAAGLNPGMTVPGMGRTALPSQPGLPLPAQTPGSGDLLYIPSEETELSKKKKKKKKKDDEKRTNESLVIESGYDKNFIKVYAEGDDEDAKRFFTEIVKLMGNNKLYPGQDENFMDDEDFDDDIADFVNSFEPENSKSIKTLKFGDYESEVFSVSTDAGDVIFVKNMKQGDFTSFDNYLITNDKTIKKLM